MSVIQQGNVALTETEEQSVNFMPDGSAEATMKWRVPWSQLFTYVPSTLQPHPVFPALLYYDGECSKESGDVGNLINRYRGIYQANPSVFEQVDGSISTTAEPIETAPIFAGVPEADPTGNNPSITPVPYADINTVNLALQNNNAPGPFIGTKKNGNGVLLSQVYYLKRIRGIDSFFRVGFTWRRNYVSNAVPDYTNLVGYIVTPPNTPYSPPSPPPGQNYLFSGIGWRQQGGVVTINEEYQLSGPGGWDIDLYTYPGIA